MKNTISIHEAKTTLSKLVQQAKAGKPVYIGAYGKPEVMITQIPKKGNVTLGTMDGKLGSVDDSKLVGGDTDVQKLFYGKDMDKV